MKFYRTSVFQLLLGFVLYSMSCNGVAKASTKHNSKHHYLVTSVSDYGENVIFTKSADYNFESNSKFVALVDGEEYELTSSLVKDTITHAGFGPTIGDRANLYLYDASERVLSLFEVSSAATASSLKPIAYSIPKDFKRVGRIYNVGDGLIITSGNVRNTAVYFLNLKNKKLVKHTVLARGERILDASQSKQGYKLLVSDLNESRISIKSIAKDKKTLSTVSYVHDRPINSAKLLGLNGNIETAIIEETVSGVFSFNYGSKYSEVKFSASEKDSSSKKLFSLDSVRNQGALEGVLFCANKGSVFWVNQSKTNVEINSTDSLKKDLSWHKDSLPISSFLRINKDGNLQLIVNFSKDVDGYYNSGFTRMDVNEKCAK